MCHTDLLTLGVGGPILDGRRSCVSATLSRSLHPADVNNNERGGGSNNDTTTATAVTMGARTQPRRNHIKPSSPLLLHEKRESDSVLIDLQEEKRPFVDAAAFLRFSFFSLSSIRARCMTQMTATLSLYLAKQSFSLGRSPIHFLQG